jgi:hypothetical protein
VADKVSVKLRGTYSSKATRYACERRKAKRLLCSDLVQLYWQEPDGLPYREIAILENVSVTGVGLFTGVPVPVGTAVRIAANDIELTGHVSQCVFRENGYIVGLDLDEKSRRERRCSGEFLPQHLLDVSLLDFE